MLFGSHLFSSVGVIASKYFKTAWRMQESLATAIDYNPKILLFSYYGPQGHTSLQIAIRDGTFYKSRGIGRVCNQPFGAAEKILLSASNPRGHAFLNATNLATWIAHRVSNTPSRCIEEAVYEKEDKLVLNWKVY